MKDPKFDIDSPSAGVYGTVNDIYLQPLITDATEAQNFAETALARLKLEVDKGYLIIPHDCRLQIYDKVAVVVA